MGVTESGKRAGECGPSTGAGPAHSAYVLLSAVFLSFPEEELLPPFDLDGALLLPDPELPDPDLLDPELPDPEPLDPDVLDEALFAFVDAVDDDDESGVRASPIRHSPVKTAPSSTTRRSV